MPVAAAGALLLLAAAFAYELWRHLGAGGDFWTFWAAARATRAGLDPYVGAALQRAGPAPPGPTAPGPFLSPIVLAQALEPLGALPFTAARLVWLALNLALSGLVVAVLLRLGGIRPRGWSLLAGAALLMAFQPYDVTLWLGQTDVVVVAAIAGAWLLMGNGRPYLGGLAMSAAAIDIHLALPFGLYLLVTADRRVSRRALAGLGTGVGALAAACLAHPGDLSHWLQVTLPHAQAAAVEPWDTLSVLQAGSEVLGRAGGRALTAALGAALLALSAVAWRRRDSTPDRDLAVCAGLTLATTTFAYNQDYLLLTLAFPFLARQWRAGASELWTGLLAFSLATGYGVAELTGGTVSPKHAAFLLGAPVLALIIVGHLPAPSARRRRAALLWGGAWTAMTLAAYGAFTAARSEIGAEVLMLSGVVAFTAMVGLRAAWLGRRPPASRGGPSTAERRRTSVPPGAGAGAARPEPPWTCRSRSSSAAPAPTTCGTVPLRCRTAG